MKDPRHQRLTAVAEAKATFQESVINIILAHSLNSGAGDDERSEP